MSFDYSYEDYDDANLEGKSIHSLEKRKIIPQAIAGDVQSDGDGSIHIDNTLSPSPQKRSIQFDMQNKGFLKRMNSTNVDSSDVSPEEERKKAKLSRMESYELNSKPQQYSMRKSPEARKKAGMSPDLGGGRLASPVNKSKETKTTAPKTSAPKSLMKQLPKEPKK